MSQCAGEKSTEESTGRKKIMKMKFIKKCPVFLSLAVSGLLFTLVGIAGRGSVYKEYKFNVAERPFLSLMMEGMSNGVKPWEVFYAGQAGSGDAGAADGKAEHNEQADGETGQSIEDFAGTDDASGKTEGIMENGKSGLDAQTAGDGGDASAAGTAGDGGNASAEGVTGTAEGDGTVNGGQTYDFSTVTEDYFDDAVFIGDSRTVGLFEYGGMEERADFFAKISLTIYDVFTAPVAKDKTTGRMITVEQALSQKKYGKVYLMLGINELGTGTVDSFMEEYRAVVEKLRELQPDAVIFVEGIMRVTGTKNESDPIFNNTNINERNAQIMKLADNQNIFYIDVNEVVCDESGNLNAEYTIDEIHLKAKYYSIWKRFLLEHGIVR